MSLQLQIQHDGLKEWMSPPIVVSVPLNKIYKWSQKDYSQKAFLKGWKTGEVIPKIVGRLCILFEQLDLEHCCESFQMFFLENPVQAKQSLEFLSDGDDSPLDGDGMLALLPSLPRTSTDAVDVPNVRLVVRFVGTAHHLLSQILHQAKTPTMSPARSHSSKSTRALSPSDIAQIVAAVEKQVLSVLHSPPDVTENVVLTDQQEVPREVTSPYEVRTPSDYLRTFGATAARVGSKAARVVSMLRSSPSAEGRIGVSESPSPPISTFRPHTGIPVVTPSSARAATVSD